VRNRKTEQMCIGCVNDQFLQYWVDLYHLDPQLEERYQPVAMRFENRLELNQALQREKIDLCIQMENAGIADAGLEFLPLCTVPEVCVSPYPSLMLQKDSLEIGDLSAIRVAFHHPEGYLLYEDELRAELRQRRGETMQLNPVDFHHSDYGIPVVLLLPRNEYPNWRDRYAKPLAWRQGIRIGFVFHPHCNKTVREYAETVKTHFDEGRCPFEW